MTGSYDWFIPVMAAPFVGSFLSVLAVRLPRGEDVVTGRSRCRSCSQQLGVRDLIPIASWIALGGRCRNCHAPIGLLYPAMEIAAVAVAAWAALVLDGWLLWASVLLGWTLLALLAMDLHSFVLSDALTLPLIAAGLVVILTIDPSRLPLHIAGALAGFTLMAAIAFAYRRLRGRDGLGGGDAKLMAAAGAWTGLGGVGSVLFCAAVGGLGLALLKSARGEDVGAHSEIPLGVGIAIGIWIVWLYGPLSLSR